MLRPWHELLQYAQEDQSRELEREWFAKLSDPGELNRGASAEEHEQHEYTLVDNKGKKIGKLRSRSIDQGERYELTIKDKRGETGAMEHTLDSVEHMHTLLGGIADRTLRKIRYNIPTKGYYDKQPLDLTWEIDVFLDRDQNPDPWVKIDLEIPRADVQLPTFPLRFESLIDNSFDRKPSKEEKATIEALFERVLQTKL